MFKKATLLILGMMLVACGDTTQEAEETTEISAEVSGGTSDTGDGFASEDERILYVMGVLLGQNIVQYNLTEEEMIPLAEGFRDSAVGTEPRLEVERYGPLIQAFLDGKAAQQMEAERELSAAFADEIAAEEGAERLDSGVIYVPVEEGDGDYPTAQSSVLVHYHGTLRDGTVFDSSVERGEPISFPLTGVIPCWTEGVQKIRAGGKAKLLCPSDTAYGDSGTAGIPGGASLLFEVELLGIDTESEEAETE